MTASNAFLIGLCKNAESELICYLEKEMNAGN